MSGDDYVALIRYLENARDRDNSRSIDERLNQFEAQFDTFGKEQDRRSERIEKNVAAVVDDVKAAGYSISSLTKGEEETGKRIERTEGRVEKHSEKISAVESWMPSAKDKLSSIPTEKEMTERVDSHFYRWIAVISSVGVLVGLFAYFAQPSTNPAPPAASPTTEASGAIEGSNAS